MIVLLTAALASGATLEEVLVTELDRAMETFSAQPEKPHYVALAVEDRETVSIQARGGTLGRSEADHERLLDVDLRVGTPELDSTHSLRGFSAMEGGDRGEVRLPVDAVDGYAVRHAIWREVDRVYRQEAERIVMIRANQLVKVEEEDPAADFQPRTEAAVDHIEVPPLELDREAWEKVLVDLSVRIESDPDVHWSSVSLEGVHAVKTFVDTEGARLTHGRNGLRVSLTVQTTGSDGDVIQVYDSKDVHSTDKLPTAEELHGWATRAIDRVEALRDTPRGQPYSGPVVLTGKASGVFFHEVFGHRVEGHRQKRESEGKTFAKYVGEPILPAFIDVYDDPTVAHMAGEDLNGHYHYDDEGTPAQRAQLVEDGVFEGFLMQRSPITGFEVSNGHGRRMAGRAPVARMGSTIIEASQTVPTAKLRQMLIDEVKKQGLPYGILVEEIEGGFTLTGRVEPNAFNVRASVSWKVYADGRPDELVRGIDLVGTPLVAFHNLIAAGDDAQVFNGHCGAESGWVPVSAVAPSLLFRRLEFQLKEKGQERPPLLSKPDFAPGESADAGEVR